MKFLYLTLTSLILIVSLSFIIRSKTDSNRFYYKPSRVSFADNSIAQNTIKKSAVSYSAVLMQVPPTDTVWGLSTFVDYATNGNSMKQLQISGDTIVVSATYVDSLGAADPNNSSSLKVKYNFSFDHGLTWHVTASEMTTNRKSRFSDLSYIRRLGIPTVGITGRLWNSPVSSTVRRAGGVYDTALGLGNTNVNILEGTLGYDLFSSKKIDGKIGGILQIPVVTLDYDTIYYTTWNPSLGTFRPLKIASINFLDNSTCSYCLAASGIDTNNLAIAYCYVSEGSILGYPLPSMRFQTSANSGNNWSSTESLNPDGMINGDSCLAYWNEDIAYKPGSNEPYVVFSTTDYTTGSNPDVSRKAYKICLWSPNLNNGNIIVVADWNNTPILSNVSNFQRIRKIHVNSRVLSHPCISFKSDGSKIAVAYSTVQVDTSSTGFNFEDIIIQYSTDDGLTWTLPANITNTTNQVEKYPAMSKTFSGSEPDILYQWDLIPGCQSFFDNQPVNRVYWIFKKAPLVVPVINYETEVIKEFSLSQNYPNPFNPVSFIKFGLPKDVNVTLKIFDILGREVATLVNEFKRAGFYQTKFDGNELASGIYFYKIEAGSFIASKKMILLK